MPETMDLPVINETNGRIRRTEGLGGWLNVFHIALPLWFFYAVTTGTICRVDTPCSLCPHWGSFFTIPGW